MLSRVYKSKLFYENYFSQYVKIPEQLWKFDQGYYRNFKIFKKNSFLDVIVVNVIASLMENNSMLCSTIISGEHKKCLLFTVEMKNWCW